MTSPHPHLKKYKPRISQYSMVHPDTIIDENRMVAIKDFCWIAKVNIIGHFHKQNLEYQQKCYDEGCPIKAVYPAEELYISNHCWINDCTILPQCTYIAPYTIIGYGAVVTKDIDKPNCIWVGNPARAVRKHDLEVLNSFKIIGKGRK